MLPSFKCQIFEFCLVYPIIQTTNTIFQNLGLPVYSVYGKISSCKKLRKSTWQILRKVCHRWMDRETDRQLNKNDFMRTLLQRGLIMFFGNSKINFLKIICLDCKPYGKNQYKKKEYNQYSSVLKEWISSKNQ